MNRVAKILCIVFLFGLSSCYDEEQFSDVPNIEFRSLEFIDTPTSDTLVLKFHFEDGDANIGLSEGDNVFSHDLFVDSEPKILTANNVDDAMPPIFLASVSQINFEPVVLGPNGIGGNLNSSTLPAVVQPIQFDDEITFECPNLINQNGDFFRDFGVTVYQLDSIFYIPVFTQTIDSTVVVPALYRETFYNIILRFQRVLNGQPEVDENGDPKFINFGEELGATDCEVGEESFNSRIPFFSEDGRSGTITYNMISFLLRLGVGDNPFQIRFYVYDRAGNRSNEVISPVFTWNEITRN